MIWRISAEMKAISKLLIFLIFAVFMINLSNLIIWVDKTVNDYIIVRNNKTISFNPMIWMGIWNRPRMS